VIKPPILLDEGGDLALFSSVERLEQYLEPIDVENGEYQAYDSTGRILRLRVRTRFVPFLLGLFRAKRKEVYVEASGSETRGADEMRSIVERALRSRGLDAGHLRTASREELVAEAVRRVGMTR
jgi:hypothetical protein